MIDSGPINLAIAYILAHINEPMTVDEIASHCHFSRYYFSRLFKAQTGESVYEFVKRVKIEQSAFRLKVEQNKPITDIGVDYGYSPSNYSSAFKQHYSVSPLQFRRSIAHISRVNPIFQEVAAPLESFQTCSSKITIRQLPDYRVVYHRHKGSYKNLSAHWGDFLDRYQAYTTPETLLLERTYDDPHITNTNGCLYDICMTIPDSCQPEHTAVLQGGKYAIYHFKGPVQNIYHALQSVFSVWLPQSGHRLDSRHRLDIYRHIDCDTMNMEIDLCTPIQ